MACLILRRVLALLLVVAGSGVAIPARADSRICIADDVIRFGNHFLGTVTSANVVVANCGDQSWSFTDVSVHPATGPAFQVSTTCVTGLALAPGGSCTVSVVFAPLILGQTSGGLWLRNTASAPDELVTFYGRGIDVQAGTASLTFIPASAAFGTQVLNSQSAPLMVEVHNEGPAALTPARFVLNGPSAYDFSSVFDTCRVGLAIPAGQGCTLALYFRPQAAGARLSNLVIDAPQLAALAILPISGTGAPPTPPTVDVIEFYNAALDHYFISSLPPDIAALDSGQFPGWVRQGAVFKAYPQSTAGTNPVCRFYLPPPQDSHFYSASPAECAVVMVKFPSFVFEAPDVFNIALPDTTTGACPAATLPVFRLFNNRVDAAHRYTTDPAIRALMLAKGYIAEGYGPNAVAMCAP